MPKKSEKSPTSKRTSAKPRTRTKRNKQVITHVLNSGQPRRRPRQERSRFTEAAIIRAATEVIDDVGWAHASTNRIAERAGVSVGSLYQYFDSKEAILSKLIEQRHEAMHAIVWSVFSQYKAIHSIEEGIRRLFQALIGEHQKDPVLTRVLAMEVPRLHAVDTYSGKSDQFIELVQYLIEHRPEVRVRNTEAAAHILVTIVKALTQWIAHDAPASLDTDDLIEEAVDVLSSYVTSESTKGKRR